MAQLTGDMIKQLAREIFDYQISDRDAHSVANTDGAMLTLARQLGDLPLTGVGPSFGYDNLVAEATLLNAKKS